MGTGVNDVVAIEYTVLKLAQAGTVEVAVFDISGRQVRQLYRGQDRSGRYSRFWDGRGADGRWWGRVCTCIECALPPIRAGNSAAASFSSRISRSKKWDRLTVKIPVTTRSSVEQVLMSGRQHPNHPTHYFIDLLFKFLY